LTFQFEGKIYKTSSYWNKDVLPKQFYKDYYIIISALTEFKKIEVAIDSFNKILNSNLLIIWGGDYKETLEKMVKWKNIMFVWPKYGDELVYIVQNSLGLIFPGEEDFWIVPIEVMAAWKPVFAYKWWWLLETNIEWVTGEFFEDKDGKDFVEKFKKFDENNKKWKYKKENCVKQAKKFDKKKFEKKILELIKL
jgi:glycosyltransferase involved in cell wall biosynthesis